MSLFDGTRDLTRDIEYYLETIVFKVEHRIFRLPRYQFERHSNVFADMFAIPQPADAEREGSSDKSPIKLEGVSAMDFGRLVRVLYPLGPIPKVPELSAHEWQSVLKLATMWHFLEVRNLAIEKLTHHAQSLDCIERILLARQYDVSTWLRSGYTDLARRMVPISVEEATKIGLEVALQIYQLREAAVVRTSSVDNIYRAVELGGLFQAEFERADAASKPLARTPKPIPAPAIKTNTSGNPTSGPDLKPTSLFGAPSTIISAFGPLPTYSPRSSTATATGATPGPRTSAFAPFAGAGPAPFGLNPLVTTAATPPSTSGPSLRPNAMAPGTSTSPPGSNNNPST